MAVRIGQGLNIGGMMSGNAAAADLLVEAGRAKGAGLAALGQGIGQGLQAFGANRRAKQARAEDMAFREQSRQDMLAERAADNARQDAEFAMRQDAWKVEVLTANRDKAAQEAALLGQIAADTGDEAAAQRAKAAESEAMRFGTALDTLLSSRMNVQGAAPRRGGGEAMAAGPVGPGGWPVGQSPSEKAARGEPTGDPSVYWNAQDYAESDAGQTATGAPSAAPMPTAATPAMPQVDPRNPYVLMETAKARMDRAETMLRNPKLGAAARNAYERLRVESAAQYGFAQSLLKDQEQAKKAQAEAEADAAYAARLTADARSAGYKGDPFQTKDAALKWLEANKQIGVMDVRNAFTALRDEKKAAILSAYREKTFGLKREALDLAKAKFELEKAGDASAASKADARLSKTWNDVADYAEQVLREYQFVTGAENLPEVQEARKLQAEAGRELIKLARDSMKPKTAAPTPAPAAGGADAKASAATEFGALPKEQQTQESWAKIKAKYGIK